MTMGGILTFRGSGGLSARRTALRAEAVAHHHHHKWPATSPASVGVRVLVVGMLKPRVRVQCLQYHGLVCLETFCEELAQVFRPSYPSSLRHHLRRRLPDPSPSPPATPLAPRLPCFSVDSPQGCVEEFAGNLFRNLIPRYLKLPKNTCYLS